MNLLLLSIFAIISIAAVESRYPYEDSYSPGDIVPHGVDVREGPYTRKQRGERGGYGGGYLNRRVRNGGYIGGYGRYRDGILPNRNYRRRYRDYDSYLPPRGIGGYNKPYDRSYDYEYGRQRKPQVHGPPRYYDEDEFNYGGYSAKIKVGQD